MLRFGILCYILSYGDLAYSPFIAAVLAQGYDLGCGVPAAKNVCLHAAAVVACWGYLVSYLFSLLVGTIIGVINLFPNSSPILV